MMICSVEASLPILHCFHAFDIPGFFLLNKNLNSILMSKVLYRFLKSLMTLTTCYVCSDSEEPDAIAPPPIYDKDIPDPPAGLTWWKYLPGVPALPTPEEYYNNASYANYGWRYDDNYVTVNYVFSGLDKVSII